jgi:hypothetical protein
MTKDRKVIDIRRGDILWIQCDPSVGVEPQKMRTCVVVSNDIANQHGRALTIVPTQAYTAERARRVYMVDLGQVLQSCTSRNRGRCNVLHLLRLPRRGALLAWPVVRRTASGAIDGWSSSEKNLTGKQAVRGTRLEWESKQD